MRRHRTYRRMLHRRAVRHSLVRRLRVRQPPARPRPARPRRVQRWFVQQPRARRRRARPCLDRRPPRGPAIRPRFALRRPVVPRSPGRLARLSILCRPVPVLRDRIPSDRVPSARRSIRPGQVPAGRLLEAFARWLVHRRSVRRGRLPVPAGLSCDRIGRDRFVQAVRPRSAAATALASAEAGPPLTTVRALRTSIEARNS